MSEREAREQALLAEIPWLRQLARELARDLHRREDLVQETCRIALSKPPRAVERGSLRAWLASVIRSVRGLGLRSQERAEVRERAHAREEAVESADESVARAELQRRLLALVLELREPSRSVLVLRYYRGLDTPAIAAKLACSEDAVRQRQSRGLAELRAKTQGDSELRHLLALGGFLPRGAREAERALRWSIAACLVVVAACLAPKLAGDPAGHGARSDLEAPPVTLAAEGAEPRPDLEEPETRAPPEGAVPKTPWLVVRVRDARTHEPIAGATIARAHSKSWEELRADSDAEWTRLGIAGSAGSYLGLSREEAVPPEPGAGAQQPFAPRGEAVLATTDREGVAVLERAPPAAETLVIRSSGRGARYLPVAGAQAQSAGASQVELNPVGALEAQVRTLEGDPIDGAFLRVEAVPFLEQHRPQVWLPLVDGLAWNGPSDEGGKLRIEGVPLDEALVVTPLSRCIGKPTNVLLSAGAANAPLDLIVAPPGGLRGRLIDEQGAPIVGASIRCTPRRPWTFQGTADRTDSDGRFNLRNLPAGPQDLICWLPYDKRVSAVTEERFAVSVEPFASKELGDLVCEKRVYCQGRIAGWNPDWFHACWIDLVMPEQRVQGMIDGQFNLPGLRGPAVIELRVPAGWMRGPAFLRRSVVLPCSDLELDVSALLASVRLRFASPPGPDDYFSAEFLALERFTSDGTPAREGGQIFFLDQPAEDGNCLGPVLPGRYRLEVRDSHDSAAWCGDVVLEAGKPLDLGTLSLGAGTIAGTLVDAPAGAEVALVRRAPFGGAAGRHGEYDRRVRAVSVDGSFSFEGLPAGLWCPTASSAGVEIARGPVVDLAVGASERLDLRAMRLARLGCRVRRGEVPVVGAVASYVAIEGPKTKFFGLVPKNERLPSDREGRIDLGTFAPGTYEVTLWVGEILMMRQVELNWAEKVELEFDAAAPEYFVTVELPPRWSDRITGLEFHPSDAEGAASRARVPAVRIGPMQFSLRTPASRGYADIWLDDPLGRTFRLPLVLRERQPHVLLRLPRGEVLLRTSGAGSTPDVPRLCLTELSTGAVDDQYWRSRWPLESAEGGWIARGIPENSTFCLEVDDWAIFEGRERRLVHFESGRLELDWP